MPHIRHTEARHSAMTTATRDGLTFQTGMSLTAGTFWAQLPGMPEDEKTTSPGLSAAARELVMAGYLTLENPRRSGRVLVTLDGRLLLNRWNAKVAGRKDV